MLEVMCYLGAMFGTIIIVSLAVTAVYDYLVDRRRMK